MTETKLDEHRCETCRYRRKSGMCTIVSGKTELGGYCDWYNPQKSCADMNWGKE